MKQVLRFLALAALICVPWVTQAQESLPYNEGFESMSSEADLTAAGWISAGDASCYIEITNSYHNTGSKALLISAWDGSSGACEVAALPVLSDPINGLQITLSYRQRTGGTVKVGYLTDANDASTFVAIESLPSSTSAFTTTTVDLSSAPNTAARIAIQQYNYYDCYIDDISVTTLPTCPKPTLSDVAQADIEPRSATVRWTPADASQTLFDIYWSTTNTAPTEATVPGAANQSGDSYEITGLTPATTYYVWIRGNCGTASEPDVSGGWTLAKSFTTGCAAISSGTWGFESPNPAGTSYCPLPACWTRPTGTSTYYPYANTSGSRNGSYSLYFYGNASSTAQIAVLPEIDGGINGKRLSLYEKGAYSFSVGYMTDPTDASTFVPVLTQTGTSSYPSVPYVVDFGEYTGNPRYIAIKSNSTGYNTLYFDDVTLGETPSCLEPTDLEVNNITTTTANLAWVTGNAGQDHWDIYYSTNSTAPTNETVPTVSNTDQNPYPMTELTSASTYYVWVRGNCGGDNSEWSTVYSFSTECEAVTIFPWSENFESYAAGNFSNPCWVNEHISGYGTGIFKVYTSSNGSNSTHQLYLPDMNSGTQTKLRLPEMTLPNANYQFVIDVYRNVGGSSYTSEGVRVYASTDGEIEGATELGFLYRNYTQTDGGVVTAETTSGWYTYEFPIGLSGTCYIILRGESQYGSATYMDNFFVEQIPTCKKPQTPMLNTPSARTAHTATLKWTNGEAGQDAWQIAYSTSPSFAPAADFIPNGTTEWLADADANPFILTGLDTNTDYYAYVRADCGGTDGVSAWSVANAHFKTVVGNSTPTDLVVEQSTITSSQATASWTGVATNDYHASYEIYWALATVTEVPADADLAADPNYISDIHATSQLISGLDPETDYKVWVRDNCGTDGKSAWTDAVTFTTASACQTPDGLDKENVTSTSATITWNTYGRTGFNLRYSTDGENWTTIENINTSPYTFTTPLSPNTAYQVQVQATCNTTEWSSTLNFRTECDAITISDGHPWTEDFEYPVTTAEYSSTSDIKLPYCWENAYNDNSSNVYAKPHLLKKNASNYNYSSPSSQVLYFYGSGNGYATLPAFTNALSDLQITFKYATESSSNGALTLGYITAADNGTYNTFTPIGESYAANSTYYRTLTPITVYLNNVPAEATRLVFRWYYSGQWGANIDDIEVSLLPSCYPVGTLAAATDITAHSAKLSWALVDNDQDAWEVQYATNDAFSENENTVPATAYTDVVINGLTQSTQYYVRVRANCGGDGYGEWSNTISFTTLDGNLPPTTLAVSNITNSGATISWEGVATNALHSSYELYYSTEITAPTNETPATETGITTTSFDITTLQPETQYYVWVRDNCGADGISTWTGPLSFTTELPCMIPNTLAISGVTVHEATLTWNGTNDHFIVERGSYDNTGTPVAVTVLNEGFEGGSMPEGWSTDGTPWLVGAGSGHGTVVTTAATGLYNAYYYNSTYSNYGRLITPVLNLSNAASATLSFKYTNPVWSGGRHALSIFYRVDGGEWIQIGTTITESHDEWTNSGEYVLPGLASNYEICFYATGYDSDYGHGVGIDDIVIEAMQYPIAWTVVNSNVANNTYTFENLDPETTYMARVSGKCGDETSAPSEPISFTTLYSFTKSISANSWYAISSPVNAPAVTDVANLIATGDEKYDLYRYNEATANWENYKNTTDHADFTTFERGRGYIYRRSAGATLSFVGTCNSGNIDVELEATDAAGTMKGWNLLGNPYAHNNYPLTRDCYSLSASGTWTAHAGSYTMAVAEAVLVKSAGETFHFTETPATKAAPASTIAFTVSNDEFTDIAYARFSSEEGLPKISHLNPEAPMLSIDGYAIANLDEGIESFPMSFSGNGEYTLTVSGNTDVTGYLHLVDRLTGSDIDLLSTPSYSFTSSPVSDRFTVKLTPDDNEGSSTSRFAIFDGNSLIVNGEGTLEVYDVMGRRLMSAEVTGSEYRILGSDLHTGVYVLRMNGNSQKIVIK